MSSSGRSLPAPWRIASAFLTLASRRYAADFLSRVPGVGIGVRRRQGIGQSGPSSRLGQHAPATSRERSPFEEYQPKALPHLQCPMNQRQSSSSEPMRLPQITGSGSPRYLQSHIYSSAALLACSASRVIGVCCSPAKRPALTFRLPMVPWTGPSGS
jgi:hypothetical protein